MTATARLLHWPTLHYVKAAGALMLVAWGMDAITGPLWGRFGIHGQALESLSTGIFWLAYIMMWILLPVAAFRPENRFYLKGDCRLRAMRFGLVLGIHVAIYLLIAISYIVAFS